MMDRRDFLRIFSAVAAFCGVRRLSAQAAPVATLQPVPAEPQKLGEDNIRITFLGTSHGRVTTTRFHSCTLLQVGGKNYIVDVGEGASALIMHQKVSLLDIHGIFITHPHLDHYGGLYGLLQQISTFRNLVKDKNKVKDVYYDSMLPCEELRKIMVDLKTAHRHGVYPPWHQLKVYKEGEIFNDGNVKVTAYGNDHMARQADGTPVAFSFLFECANGKRVFFSGDLHKSFDLPLAGIQDKGVDLLVCELVHYPLKNAVERLKGLPVKKICFQHHGDSWEAAGWKQRFEAFASQLTMPAEIVSDGVVRIV